MPPGTRGEPVLVVGTVAFDIVGSVPRFPAPDESSQLSALKTDFGGCAGNVARRLSGLKVPCRLHTAVGPDFADSAYERALKDDGIDLGGLVWSDRPTAHAIMINDGGGRQLIFYHPGASEDMGELEPRKAGVGHFAPGEFTAYPALMRECARVTFDPGQETYYRPPEQIKACLAESDVLFANSRELRRIARAAGPVRRLLKDGLEAVIETLGKEGCNLHTAEGGVYVPAPQVKAVDPTGAGDAHRAGFLAGLRRGFSFLDATRLANVVGSFAVQEMGAQAGIVGWDQAMARYAETFGEPPKA